jgi:hypothetical protein
VKNSNLAAVLEFRPSAEDDEKRKKESLRTSELAVLKKYTAIVRLEVVYNAKLK